LLANRFLICQIIAAFRTETYLTRVKRKESGCATDLRASKDICTEHYYLSDVIFIRLHVGVIRVEFWSRSESVIIVRGFDLQRTTLRVDGCDPRAAICYRWGSDGNRSLLSILFEDNCEAEQTCCKNGVQSDLRVRER
jgi:hypothetical protein